MKYLLSPLQLGQLIQEDDKYKREELIKEWMKLYYVVETHDDKNLNDHIKINELIRKKLRKKR